MHYKSRSYLIVFSFLLLGFQVKAQELIIPNNLRFLALGDSYTIGQDVNVSERWPNQLVDKLAAMNYEIEELKIIAQTGWTTGSLINSLASDTPSSDYNLVSILIGVNNQFQGRSEEEYAAEFTELIEKALGYANSDSTRVFVVAIPDYGVTPFGQDFDNVSFEIDRFNLINKEITAAYNLRYIDIVNISRRASIDPSLVASDGLHPSGKMYSEWVNEVLASAVLEDFTITSLEETSIPTKRIYPNPTTSIIHLPIVASSVEIFDSKAQVVYSNNALDSDSLDTGFLKRGSYQIKMVSGKETINCRFIKY